MAPPWIVQAWPPCGWPAEPQRDHAFRHAGTTLRPTARPGEPASGQTLWAAAWPEGPVGIAWDWVALRPGVYVMTDPLGLVSNLRFAGHDGAWLTGLPAALRLNQIVNRLAWQPAVAEAVATQEAAVPG